MQQNMQQDNMQKDNIQKQKTQIKSREVRECCYTYSWYIDETEEEYTCIRIYGLSKKNENICIRVDNFTPYVYIELPTNIIWNASKAQLLGNKLDELTGEKKPLSKVLVKKKKLYGAYLEKDLKTRKLFPYLFCSFSHKNDLKNLMYKLRTSIHIVGLGPVKLKIHECDADPILQLTCCRKIPTAGWINFDGKLVDKEEQITLCDFEYKVKWKTLNPLEEIKLVPRPKLLSFDIEVNSTDPSAMPKSEKPGDKVFQISCILCNDGDCESKYKKFLLSLGDPEQEKVGIDVNIIKYKTEAELLEGFTNFINEYSPNLILGYNILGFDIPYMIARSKYNFCLSNFDKQGFHKTQHAKEKIIKWSSSAYKNQEFTFLDAEGRLFVDLLPLIRRDYKFNNYKLNTVAEYFIGETKDPLDVKGIFKCYRIGTKKDENGEYSKIAKKAMGIIGKYCIQDAILVNKLSDKLKIWVGLTEMAKTCKVPIFSLYTQGQQIKVYSQVYDYCMSNDIVVEKDGYQLSDDEKYVGAKVFPPVPGKYHMVVPFDFASLYPTTIIAYNIDYHTWIPNNSNIPDEMCHIMEWEDHISCCHDPKVIRKLELSNYINSEKEKIKKLREKRDKISARNIDKIYKKELMDEINNELEKLKPYILERSEITKTITKNCICAKRTYKFLKEPKGVLPTILQNLLDARKYTRKVDMKTCQEEIELLKKQEIIDYEAIKTQQTLLDVLDKRQLSYKISANSMYGAMGVKKGYLPFMPGAMVTTYMGRTNIEIVADIIPKKYGGELVYGDTDCVVEDTPVLIQYFCNESNRYKIKYEIVENISDGIWTKINSNKEISSAKKGYKIWSDNGFTDILNVVRCGIIKPISQIITSVGEIVCSNEHSLLRDNLESVKPTEIKLQDKLCISNFPIIYDNNELELNNKLDLVFVWGVFFGKGEVDKNKWQIKINNYSLLKKCLNIIYKYEPEIKLQIIELKNKNILSVLNPTNIFIDKYIKLFYNKKNKKIPDIIFNSSNLIRKIFFKGYNNCCCIKNFIKNSFLIKGTIGAASLFFLMKSLNYEVSIKEIDGDKYLLNNYIIDKNKINEVIKIKEFLPINKNKSKSKSINYLYDIQTSNHHFAAGVGQLVVHNSNYIHFPHLKTAEETWDHAINVAKEVTTLFPKPIELEFEHEIYSFFFILSKKRYMYRKCFRDGLVNNKIGKKGVLLARRDNSKFIRDLYESVISKIADNIDIEELIYYIILEINKLCSGSKSYIDFVITKSVGNANIKEPQIIENEKGIKKIKLGDYIVPYLSDNIEEKKEQMLKKNADTVEEYYLLCLPAQIQLAERMRQRGMRVDIGSRLEYIVTGPEIHTAKQYEKVESVEYYIRHQDIIKIDYLYYLKQIVNPLDQLLDVIFDHYNKKHLKGLIMCQYKLRLKYYKVIQSIKNLFKPKIILQ